MGTVLYEESVAFATGDGLVVFVLVVRGTNANWNGWFGEAGPGFEAGDGLRWAGRDGDREIFHLLPARAVLVVVVRALVDEERDDDVRVNFIAHRDLLGLAVTGHDVSAGAGAA